MKSRSRWARPALVLAALALPLASGCADLNESKDDRTGRGKGDQLPATGNASHGTNSSTSDVTTEGPGSKVVGKAIGVPSASTPYGGDGAGAAPPVTPAKGEALSGEANSGQKTGQDPEGGRDKSLGTAKPAADNGGPGTGTPPR